LRLEVDRIRFSKVSLPGSLDYCASQFSFQEIQAGFRRLLLLKEGRLFGGVNGSVSRRVDLGSENFVSSA